MAQTEKGWVSTQPASTGTANGDLTREDVVALLVREFGDQYQESYEEGRRNFRDAIVRHFDLPADDVDRLLDDLEQSRAIRFHRQGVGAGVEVPRVGLFDTPETVTPDNSEREYAGRYWVIGHDGVIPGVS